MLFAVLARKMYARNLQYRGAHMIHNIGSALFGFIYISIWAGIAGNRAAESASPLGEYGLQGLIGYIAFNQACLWITLFVTAGLGMEQSVRTGQISLELMRPVHLFYHLMSKEWGQIAYQAVYKSLPIYLLYFFVFSLRLPKHPLTYVSVAAALACAAYITICINYLIGVIALWTTESRWFFWVHYALAQLLSGFFIPVEWLPRWLNRISIYSPYPYLQYHPTRMYLEMEGPAALAVSLAWCAAFTLICLLATRTMRRKVEVQGG